MEGTRQEPLIVRTHIYILYASTFSPSRFTSYGFCSRLVGFALQKTKCAGRLAFFPNNVKFVFSDLARVHATAELFPEEGGLPSGCHGVAGSRGQRCSWRTLHRQLLVSCKL